MKKPALQGPTLALLAVIVSLLALFVYVALRSGPLAPVAVTVSTVESRTIVPALFGIGTVEARYTYRIGPTFAGRVKQLDVHVGDRVTAGQVLGEMDPVDLDDRVRSLESAYKRSQAALREAEARQVFAKTQAHRYEQLFEVGSTSEEVITTKRQELQIADAALSAAQENLAGAMSDQEALVAQRANLRLTTPVDGVVVTRHVDPGTTVVAGQAVVDVIDPTSLWVNVRFDQISASGLAAGLPAHIVLRSSSGQVLHGKVLRLEPVADAVTEEMLAKVVFDTQLKPLPPIGELAEVTVELPALATSPVIPNAAIQHRDAKLGVWQIVDGGLQFTSVTPGTADLDGLVQVLDGLKAGDQLVVYSEKTLSAHSPIHVVDHLPGINQ